MRTETLLIELGTAVLAGLVGSLVGLGGGILIVPVLTLGLGLDFRYAAGASIVAVIATSSGAAAAYVRDRLTNMRVAMFLELATSSGAVVGALLVGVLPAAVLYVVFGLTLAVSTLPLVARLGEELPLASSGDALSRRLRLGGSYPDARLGREVAYAADRVPLGFLLMLVAGVLSGLLGIGSGALKVLAMDTVMRLPMKVSTTTSNFMIGVTAAASAGVYLGRGDVLPLVVAPVALGVLLGAGIGSRLLNRLANRTVRLVFLPFLLLVALQMILRGFGVSL